MTDREKVLWTARLQIRNMTELIQGFLTNADAWVIGDKTSGKIVGYITADIPYRKLGVGEIRYVIGEKYQKRGYAFFPSGSLLV